MFPSLPEVSQSIKIGLKTHQTFTTILSHQIYLSTNRQTRHNAHLCIETRCSLAWENISPTIALIFQRSVEEIQLATTFRCAQESITCNKVPGREGGGGGSNMSKSVAGHLSGFKTLRSSFKTVSTLLTKLKASSSAPSLYIVVLTLPSSYTINAKRISS